MSRIDSTSGRPHARLCSRLFAWLCAGCTWVCVFLLAFLLWKIGQFGWVRLDGNLISQFPTSRLSRIQEAGVLSPLVGSIYLILLTAGLSVPIGIGTAIYLEEYCRPSRWRWLVQTNIANLAGVPSIVYGILGLSLFVRALQLNRSLLAGALTLTLVVLPIVILASQEALRAVPSSIRQASYALGATRWQTVWRQLMPAALPGMLTGVILALSRALGEAAPLVAIGAATTARFIPQDLTDSDFTAMPLQIYHWTGEANPEFHQAAAAAIVVLLIALLCINALAIALRYQFTKTAPW